MTIREFKDKRKLVYWLSSKLNIHTSYIWEAVMPNTDRYDSRMMEKRVFGNIAG